MARKNVTFTKFSFGVGGANLTNFTINVNLDVPVTDIVYVTINNKEYAVDVVDGIGSLVVSDILDANIYNVSAVFEGTSAYSESNAISNFTVSPLTTKLVASKLADAIIEGKKLRANKATEGKIEKINSDIFVRADVYGLCGRGQSDKHLPTDKHGRCGRYDGAGNGLRHTRRAPSR